MFGPPLVRYLVLLSLLLAPRQGAAFITSPDPLRTTAASTSSTQRSIGLVSGDDRDKTNRSVQQTQQEAAEALMQAQAAIQSKNVPDVWAAAAGGAMLGAGLELAAQHGDANPVVPAAIVGSAVFAASAQDTSTGRLTRTVLGKPTQMLGNFFVDRVKSFFASVTRQITSIPDKIAQAFTDKVEQTKDDFVSLPARMLQFLLRKVEATLDDVKAMPGRWVQDLQQAPGRMAASAVKAAEQAAEEAKKYPRLKLSEFLETNFDNKSLYFSPKPPKMPPPADKIEVKPRSILFRPRD